MHVCTRALWLKLLQQWEKTSLQGVLKLLRSFHLEKKGSGSSKFNPPPTGREGVQPTRKTDRKMNRAEEESEKVSDEGFAFCKIQSLKGKKHT